MNKNDDRKIAESITNEQLQQMFETAKIKIKNWRKISNVNKRMTKGAIWNILAKDFYVNYNYDIIIKTNMILEFGEFLPNQLKPQKKSKQQNNTPFHQEPQF